VGGWDFLGNSRHPVFFVLSDLMITIQPRPFISFVSSRHLHPANVVKEFHHYTLTRSRIKSRQRFFGFFLYHYATGLHLWRQINDGEEKKKNKVCRAVQKLSDCQPRCYFKFLIFA
jgi:hypothetical protein